METQIIPQRLLMYAVMYVVRGARVLVYAVPNVARGAGAPQTLGDTWERSVRVSPVPLNLCPNAALHTPAA